jgi:hypothetical protein
MKKIKPNYHWLEIVVFLIIIVQCGTLFYQLLRMKIDSTQVNWEKIIFVSLSEASNIFLSIAILVALKTALSLRDKIG